MAKFCALLVLALVCVVRAVRIDPPSIVRTGKYFSVDVKTTIDDPICRNGNGLYPHPSDCTRYLACRDGESQERGCPEGFKFDSLRYCTHEENADCGVRKIAYTKASMWKCPESYGMFADPEDCHKYMVCVDAEPLERSCPKGEHYQDNVGCVGGQRCPKEAEKSKVCIKADGLYPHDNCLRFYKCVNFQPEAKRCPRGKAFDPKKATCTREQFMSCRRNDVQDIMRAE